MMTGLLGFRDTQKNGGIQKRFSISVFQEATSVQRRVNLDMFLCMRYKAKAVFFVCYFLPLFMAIVQ